MALLATHRLMMQSGPPPKLVTTGQARETISGKTKALKQLDGFLTTSPKYKCTFDWLHVEVVCDQDLWLELAYYLLNEAQSHTSGEPIKGGTVVEYLRKAIGIARDKFGQHQIQKYREFFEVLDRPDDPRNWLKGAVRQIHVSRFHHTTPPVQSRLILIVVCHAKKT